MTDSIIENSIRLRKSFGKIKEVMDMPNLIEVQKESYRGFLQQEIKQENRTDTGLQAVFKSVFPIHDFAGQADLEFISYVFDKPKYDVEECIQRDATYAAPLRVILRLIIWDTDEETGAKSIRDIKEQDVFMGDLPLMTDKGTFIINGTERVIVSQMQRSPGVFFDHDKGKTHSSGKLLFSARIIPYHGSWLDFEFDAKDILYVRIDRRRKLPVTTFLYALDGQETHQKKLKAQKQGKEFKDPVSGMNAEEIFSLFYQADLYVKDKQSWNVPFNPEQMRGGVKLSYDLKDAKTSKVLIKAGEKLTFRKARQLKEEGVTEIKVPYEAIIGKFIASDMINEETGEIYIEAGDEITEDVLVLLEEQKLKEVPILHIDNINIGAHIRNTMAIDKNKNREEALLDIYRVMRPGEPPTVEAAEVLFENLFFNSERYNLSSVGRVKMNMRLDTPMDEADENVEILRKEDIVKTLQTLVQLKDGQGDVDDIDNLGNRRVRSVGELIENYYRMGLLRMERSIRERMSAVDIDSIMPHDLINAKPVVAVLREFFGSSQLSQFMDQTNPLAEITHKRRLSALGPGGLTRERAGFEVRDVHPTHYGRICPIETPEGPNIGLINSLATHAIVNKYGFIEAPYRRVKNGCVTDEVIYMSAMEEKNTLLHRPMSNLIQKESLSMI